jgi:hypothetical protein
MNVGPFLQKEATVTDLNAEQSTGRPDVSSIVFGVLAMALGGMQLVSTPT